jgi:FkbM family methyltransferase
VKLGDRLFKSTPFTRPALYDKIIEARLVESYQCAIDVGACVGSWSVAMCDDFPDVVAFEPVAHSRKILLKHSAALDQIVVRDEALMDKPGYVTMGVDRPKKAVTLTSYFAKSDSKGDTKAITLDSLGYAPGLIKIDVEGAELRVLQGAQKTIEQYGPVLVIEFNNLSHRFGYSEDSLLYWLKQRAYREVMREGVDRVFSV